MLVSDDLVWGCAGCVQVVIVTEKYCSRAESRSLRDTKQPF